ncbi:aarF domain-containing kinase [Nematocida sp. LUAm3]|nr:aarF domain-containing kinase [Nematocida sp. LUAm3]KAI5174612.1 aarF domain-containing kinase [Nematocida sp. LUAm2]KAI5177982.1 aarF domain-containing kinase [Nematocida sp. LUAm1]
MFLLAVPVLVPAIEIGEPIKRNIPKAEEEKGRGYIMSSIVKTMKFLSIDAQIGVLSVFLPKKLQARIIYRILTGNGAVAMKFGQFLSMHTDTLPTELTRLLKTLQKEAPGARKNVYEVFRKETGIDLPKESVKEIVGSGCIAQVYRVVLNRKEYALKIIDPEVRKNFISDMVVANVFSRVFGMHRFFQQFRGMMEMQLDLRNEHRHMDALRRNFSYYTSTLENPSVLNRFLGMFRKHEYIFPKPIVSTKNILLMDYWKGDASVPLSSSSLLFMYLKMIFKDGYIHADLHRGNIQGISAPTPTTIVYDAGLVHQLTKQERRNLSDLLSELLLGKTENALRLIVERNPKNILSKDKKDRFIGEGISLYSSFLKKNSYFSFLPGVYSLTKKHNVFLDETYTNIMVSSMYIHTICRKSHEKYNFPRIFLETGLFSKYLLLLYRYFSRKYIGNSMNV